MKKLWLVFVINISAFAWIMVAVYTQFGGSFFFKIVIPSAIIFGGYLGALLGVLSKNRTGDVTKGTDQPGQGRTD